MVKKTSELIFSLKSYICNLNFEVKLISASSLPERISRAGANSAVYKQNR